MIKKFDSSGNVALVVAACMPILLGAAGVAMLFAEQDAAHVSLQTSLDTAVLAGTAMEGNASDSRRIEMAQRVFATNLSELARSSGAKFAVSPIPTFSVNMTEVSGQAHGQVENTLGAMIGISQMSVDAKSKAQKQQSHPLCVLALSKASPASIEVYGNAQFNAHDCAAQANSSNGEGLKTYGSKAQSSASEFGVTGDFSGQNWNPTPTTGVLPVQDPYANLPIPQPDVCVNLGSKLQGATITLDPGTYCGGLDIMAGSVVSLNPGTYIMKDGQFAVGSGSSVTGDEVMIALVGADSYLLLKSGSTTKLTSPMTGTYKNMQFMSDRDLSQSKQQQEWTTIMGGATLDYDGVMYLPEQQIWASGASLDIIIKANSPSLSIVADKVWAQGNVVYDITQTNPRGLTDMAVAPSFAYSARIVK